MGLEKGICSKGLVLFHGPGIVDPSRCCTIWATTVLHLHDIATDSEPLLQMFFGTAVGIGGNIRETVELLKVHDMAAEFHRITTHFFEDRSLRDLWLVFMNMNQLTTPGTCLDAQCSRQQIRQLDLQTRVITGYRRRLSRAFSGGSRGSDLWLLLRAWVPRAHQLPMSLLTTQHELGKAKTACL